MSKQVIINQADLDKLEEARCALFDFLEEKGLTEDTMDLVKITNITQHMWNLANKKHEEYIPTKAYKCSVYRKGLKSGVITPAGELITLTPRLGEVFSRKDEGYLAVGYSDVLGENYKSYAELGWEEIYLTHAEIKDLEIRESKTKWREEINE